MHELTFVPLIEMEEGETQVRVSARSFVNHIWFMEIKQLPMWVGLASEKVLLGIRRKEALRCEAGTVSLCARNCGLGTRSFLESDLPESSVGLYNCQTNIDYDNATSIWILSILKYHCICIILLNFIKFFINYFIYLFVWFFCTYTLKHICGV